MKTIVFLSLLFVLFTSLSVDRKRRHKSHTTAPAVFTILGDAGSTGTRLFFFPLNGNKLGAIKCSLKDGDFLTRLADNVVLYSETVPENDRKNEGLYKSYEARLGDALKSNLHDDYAEKVKFIINQFEAGVGPCAPAIDANQKSYNLMIFSTAGSRLILNQMNPEHLQNAVAFQSTNFANSLKEKFPANTFPQIVLKVISGRMEGILGFASLKRTFKKEKESPWAEIKRAPIKDIVYYEVGGASSQIVWADLTPSRFLQTRKAKGIVNLQKFPSSANLPAKVYSKSFLGNGGEETLNAAMAKIQTCTNAEKDGDGKMSKRIICLKKGIKESVITAGSDVTASADSYAMQWTSVAGNLKRTFFASGDTNTKYFILNSKSISGSYATRFEHENPVARAFSNIFSTWESQGCNNKKCTLYFHDRKAFKDDIYKTIKNTVEGLKVEGGNLDVKVKKNFPNQGLGIGLQLISVLEFLKWPGPIVVYNFGEWTDGAEFLLNSNVNSASFDGYQASNTNQLENQDFTLSAA